MPLGLTDIMDAVAAHAGELGWFDNVTAYEPRNAPGKGLSAAIWVDEVRPVAAFSGLDSTAIYLVLSLRLSTSMTAEPQSDIDPNLLAAADELMASFTGDFTLGGLVNHIDLLGKHGVALAGKAGYLNADGLMLRVFQITLPMVLNSTWDQEATE